MTARGAVPDGPISANLPQLRVANVHLEGSFGGPQRRTAQVAERLLALGVETVVVMPEIGSDLFCQRLSELGIETIRLSLHRLSRRHAALPRWAVSYVPEVMRLAWALRAARVSVVHCNGVWQTKGLLAAKLAGAKAILHLNDTWNPVGIRALFAVMRRLADGVIVTGSRVVEVYYRGPVPPGTKLMQIQSPVDTTRYDPARVAPDPQIARDSGLKIAVIGHVTPTKGVEYFIEMAARLAPRYPTAGFYIIGPVPPNQQAYGETIKRLIATTGVTNLHLFGATTTVDAVLKSIDIFVCPSLTEAGPMSVWEAMAMEKGIVATDVDDVAKYVRDGEAGFIVPIRDAAALADRVARLVDDPELRHRFGVRARAIAREALDVDIAAVRHRDFYRQVTAG